MISELLLQFLQGKAITSVFKFHTAVEIHLLLPTNLSNICYIKNKFVYLGP
jgi:hypothetical protein